MDRRRDERAAWAIHHALDGRHPADAAALLDDASLLHIAGGSGLAGDYQGREAIVALLSRMDTLTEGSLRCGVAHTSGTAEGALVLVGPVFAVRNRRTLDTFVRVEVLVDRDKVREVWLSYQDQRAFDRFWV